MYKAIDSNDYIVFVVAKNFSTEAPFDLAAFGTFGGEVDDGMLDLDHTTSIGHRLQDSVMSLEPLDNRQCISNYAARFLSGRRHLLALTDISDSFTLNANNSNALVSEDSMYDTGSLLEHEVVETNTWTQQSYGEDPLDWMCSSIPENPIPDGRTKCSVSRIDASDWSIFNFRIKYCRSEKVEEHCELQLNQLIGLVVVSCNLVKVCCMVVAAFMLKQDTLCTLG